MRVSRNTTVTLAVFGSLLLMSALSAAQGKGMHDCSSTTKAGTECRYSNLAPWSSIEKGKCKADNGGNSRYCAKDNWVFVPYGCKTMLRESRMYCEVNKK